jgi:hypothetical protein
MHAMTNLETRVDATGNRGRSSSQEQIVSVTGSRSTTSGDEVLDGGGAGNGHGNGKMEISKTVEFVFHESEAQPV